MLPIENGAKQNVFKIHESTKSDQYYDGCSFKRNTNDESICMPSHRLHKSAAVSIRTKKKKKKIAEKTKTK